MNTSKMLGRKKCLSAFLCALLLHSVNAEVEKSSLTFVIDDTGSMQDDINGVKDCTNQIFDTVMKSNTSQIENFILVTFNDPDFKHLTTTRDRGEFKRALAKIDVDGGGDCPEMSMSGIKLALEVSRPGSLLYVFTDASAKDHDKHNHVTSLAQKKYIQVVFVLTGKCSDGNDEVYYQVAKATDGQVFNLNNKKEVPVIIEHVKIQVQSKKQTIANKDFPAGTHQLQFEVDSKMKELVISVSGSQPTLIVTDPVGKIAPIEEVVKRSTFTIVKVTEIKPGTYMANVTSTTRNTIVIKTDTSVHFQHGFSTFRPTSIKETVTKPIPGENSHLSIKLATDSKNDVILDAVQILDLDDKVLTEQPLKLINEEEQFYITESTVVPPNSLFRVAIKGHDTKGNETITRISLTPIEPQRVDITVTNKKPNVTVIGGIKINAEYNQTLLLKCKVSGHPKPKVIWQRDDGILLDSTLSLVEYPDDYLSTLSINQVLSNNTYYCVARNAYGEDVKQIEVKTVRKTYFVVIKKPKDATIEVDKEALFECVVDAYPPAEVSWYKNGKEVLENDNVKISPNKSLLLIKHMLLNNVGKYRCLVKNDIETRNIRFNLQIDGVESPVIDKTVGEIHVKDGSNVEILCSILHGNPKPRINWYYQESDGTEYSLEENKDKEKIQLLGVTLDSTGYRTYLCEAYNDLGSDYHKVYIMFDYPPKINGKQTSEIVAKVGDKVHMDCDVDGEPKPTVKWLLNNTELILTARHGRGYRTHDFNFQATEEDSGIYTCQATNTFGTAEKNVNLHIAKPPTIEVPAETTYNVKVGEYLELLCHADGFPKPYLNWVFHSKDAKIRPQNLGSSERVSLGRLQIKDEGYYTCNARNIVGSFNLTYEVTVLAPPNIENIYPEKTFTAVIGDLVLRIPCKASGKPKPEITWIKEGVDKVAAGTDWYDIEDDGTLIIKNVDKISAGPYVCEARNSLGLDTETYDVVVEPYPKPGPPTRTENVQRGKSMALKCDIPGIMTDRFRWFKDGREVSLTKNHHIINAQLSDAGVYTCRMSDFAKSRSSGSIQVNVGSEPKFLFDEKELIDFEEGMSAVMECRAEGNPTPKISWWHEGKNLTVENMTYIFDMKLTNRGKYFCLVENEFGLIRRKFEIISQECLLNMETELQGNQPLMLSSKLDWTDFENVEGLLKIKPSESMILFCPNSFKNLPKREVTASCERDTFIVDGKTYRFSELQCKEQVLPVARRTGKNCLISNPSSNTIKVGYEVRGKFIEVYEICLDMNNRNPIYSKHNIHYTLANMEPKEKKWHNNELVSYNIDKLYDCELQINTISSLLRSWFHREDKCCFSKRQLVNPRDVPPGLPQIATYTALNLMPQWSSCNSENWESIERRVRALARSSSSKLHVWTGNAGRLQMSGQNISIYDDASKEQPVPKYLWKVIQDPTTQASLAIVQLNIPDVTLAEAYRHLLCRDICQEVNWMKNKFWRDVTKGFTFCCNILDFERALGYDNIFNRGTGKVLYDVSLVAGHSLV